MPTLTETLIDKILAVKYDALPAAAIDMAKACTLDGIAVMLAGATEPLGLGRIVTQYVKDSGGNPQATVIAGGFKTSMVNAAYANGTMAHALDFDNTWYPLNHRAACAWRPRGWKRARAFTSRAPPGNSAQ